MFQVVYNNQKFASTIDLVKKYNSDQVQKIKIPAPSEDLLERASLRKRGKNMPVTPSRGPAFVEPNGKRFSINGRKIKYMNWEFHVAVRSSAGPALFDVQFSGKRIAYEISVQEGVSYYSAHDPKESSAQYIDSGWGLGSFNMEMIKGIDCPETGVLMDSYHFMDTDKAFTNPDSICVFETNAGIPSRRHREFRFNKEGSAVEGFWFLGGMVDHALVVRVISTPFNYDYIFDFILHQNGIIEVKTSTAGYLQATFYTPKENDYGFHHFNNTIGTIHDHFILYKVDLDIAGVQNSYQTVDVVVKNKSYEWEPGTYRIKKTVVKDKKAKEKDALLRFNFAEPKYLVVINENQKNLYNNPVGYRIQPVSMVKEKYPDDYFATKAAAWTKYQLAVTEQKDDERFGSCLYNQFHMTDPACNFDTYVNDNDDIKNKDLVAWVTVGGLHIPNTEDIPTTNTNGNAYTFFLKPYGYFDEDPSMGSTNAMLIEKGKDGKIKIDTYDTPERSQCPVPSRKIEYKRG